MKLHNKIATALTLSASMLAANTASAEFNRGEMLANTCVGCHGPMGISQGAAPSIGGLSATYFTDTMIAYREGERPSTIMTRIAKGYSDEDIEAMAAYFAAQKFSNSPYNTAGDAKMVSAGQKLHSKFCEKCHADNGTDPEDDAGFLKGQTHNYLTYSLEDFMSGDREMDKKMAKKLKQLHAKYGDKGIQAVVEFYADADK